MIKLVSELPWGKDILSYKLEDRRQVINEFYRSMEGLSPRLSRYVEDVQHAKEIGLNSSVVSHLTYNLVLTISKATRLLNTYEYIRSQYLLDDEYDKTYDIWKDFFNKANEIKALINSIEDDYFEGDIVWSDFIKDIIPPNLNNIEGFELDESNCDMERIDIEPEYLVTYITMANSVGVGLLKCLKQQLKNTEGWLSNLKRGFYLDNEEYGNYDYIYEINYSLYKQEYWPKEGQNFRHSVEEINFHHPLTQEKLEQYSYDERIDFYKNPTGALWRDYSTNKKDLYFEAKRICLKEEQWRYLFKQICRFEAYDEWIEELKRGGRKEYENIIFAEEYKNKIVDIREAILPFIDDGLYHIDKTRKNQWLAIVEPLKHIDGLLITHEDRPKNKECTDGEICAQLEVFFSNNVRTLDFAKISKSISAERKVWKERGVGLSLTDWNKYIQSPRSEKKYEYLAEIAKKVYGEVAKVIRG